jgi:transposase
LKGVKIMDVIYQHCCGLDIHKKVVVACMLSPKGKEIHSFGTMTDDIFQLIDWIKSQNCECVAMESTGVYWKPIYNLLELEGIKTMVVNAQHIKNVPGRKTDVKDAEWIAKLLKHGLLKASFVPSKEQRELRELVRYRRKMIQERSSEMARVQSVLEGANIKLASVASDVLGVSGRLMLDSIINGETDPEKISILAKGTLRKKIPELNRALAGLIGEHQKMLLSAQLEHIDFLNNQIEKLSDEIARRLSPDKECIELLDTIPGIGEKIAETVLVEIGTDMDQFSSAANLSSWAGVVPGCNESAGKKKVPRLEKEMNF